MNSQDQMWRDVRTASAGGRDRAALALLALPTMVATLELGVLFLVLPALTEDLRASATQQLWTRHIYGFFIAGFLAAVGTLGDRFSRRRVLLTGAGAFAGLSVPFEPRRRSQLVVAHSEPLGSGVVRTRHTLASRSVQRINYAS